MKMKIYTPFVLSLLAVFLFTDNTNAQISFTNSNQLLPSTNYSGVAIGITDVDGDNLDDIVRFSNGAKDLGVLYQDAAGATFSFADIGASGSGKQWTLSIADTDHNGFADMLTGGYNFSQLDMTETGGNSFNAVDLPGNFFAQGSNFVDINNDGHLDIFVCNDDGESYIYENDGSGNFAPANDWIDMSINGSSGEDASGNYGSVWTDFDNDGDTDLYIAKCRLGVSSSTDERRINKLFVNDGNNTFTEKGADYGLRIGWQSWTAEFQDIDNDGDFDCFVTNHDYPSQLLLNDGTGHFTDITDNSGITIDGLAIQAFFKDFDNDGFVDLLVAGTDQYLYKNNGDLTFTAVASPFDNNNMESCAIGDLNNDGHLDIYAGYAGTYNNPSNIEDVLWLNEGNDNSWFKVHLEGTASNLDGVGARVEIYGDFGMQVREVRSGEGYGVTNSLIQHFGLSTFQSIETVVVKWPSGIVDVIDNPTINATLEIVEGDCMPTEPEIAVAGNTSFCEGGTVELTAPIGETYLWSNGATTATINASQSGNYSVVVGDDAGCYQLSQIVNVTVTTDVPPVVTASGPLTFCEGENVVLTSSESTDYDWSNGGITQSVVVMESGDFTVTTQGACDEVTSNTITVDVLQSAPQAQVTEPVVEVLLGEDAVLEATGNNLSWYDAPTDGNLLYTGPTVTLEDITAPVTLYVENSDAEVGYVAPESYVGDNPYSSNFTSVETFFNVETEILLKSVKVYTDEPGERLIQLKTSNNQVYLEALVDIPVGENRIELNFLIPPGNNYRISTDQNTNFQNFGYPAPRLQRSNQGVTYPYTLEDVVEITGNTTSEFRFYHFYDWEVQTPAYNCIQDRVEVAVTVASDVIDLSKTDKVKVFPNPGNGDLTVELDVVSDHVELVIRDLLGRTLISQELNAVNGLERVKVDATDFATGTYLLEVRTGEEVYFGKVVVE
ncbi:MAG: FG-GAP-like repeat-containing protein [Saprospiraceae bacterium]